MDDTKLRVKTVDVERGVCIVRSVGRVSDHEVLAFVVRLFEGHWEMWDFQQENPYRVYSEAGDIWEYILKEVK